VALFEHFHKRIAGVLLQLRFGPLAHGAARWRRAQMTVRRTAWRRSSRRWVDAWREGLTQPRAPVKVAWR
jgi:hypothetical protein